MLYLKQSTASQAVLLGPFIDEDDGKTAEAGLTIANTDIRLSANGGNMFSKTAVGGTHDEAGWYTVTFDATDTATVGRLQVSVDVAGALPVWMEFQVLEEDIYDALVAASAAAFDTNQRVDVGEWLGTAAATPTQAGVPEVDITFLGGVAQSLLDLKDFADAGYDPATDKVQGVVLVDTTTTNTDVRGTDGVDTATMRGTNSAFLASVGGALADVAADGDVTSADTVMQYLKQLINVLMGTPGIVVWPASVSPGNGVSMAEALRAVFDDVTGLNGDVMRGTDSAATHAAADTARLVNPQINTALNNITFEMYDSTTHNPSAGLTVTGERSLDGGAYAAVTGTIAGISDGTYQLDASQADMNGALIVFRFSEGTADDTFVHVKTAA